MPLISDLKNKQEKKRPFKKKEYRPWDSFHEKEPPKTQSLSLKENASHEQNPPKEEKEGGEEVQEAFLLEKEWRGLYGAKKKVFLYLMERIEEKDAHKGVTKNITISQISNDLEVPPNTIKGAIQHLKKSNLLHTEEKKPGRGGYARYSIVKHISAFFQKKMQKE